MAIYLTRYDYDLLNEYYSTPDMILEPFPISPVEAMPMDDEVKPFKVYEDILSEKEVIDLCDLLDHQKSKMKSSRIGHGKVI